MSEEPAFHLTIQGQRTVIIKALFLKCLAACGNITQAARDADIDRGTHYDWLREDPAYKGDVCDAMERAADALVEEARRRAVEGVDEPIYQAGERMVDKDGNPAVLKRYSDGLLTFLLRGDRPEKYRDKNVNVTGRVTLDAPPQITNIMLALTGDELRSAMLARMEGIRIGQITGANDPDNASLEGNR